MEVNWRRRTVPSNIMVGDMVLRKNEKKGKLIPFYDPKPRVIQKQGSQVTAKRADRMTTRDVSFFKKVETPNTHDTHVDLYSSDDDEEITHENDAYQLAGNARPQRDRKRPAYLGDYTV